MIGLALALALAAQDFSHDTKPAPTAVARDEANAALAASDYERALRLLAPLAAAAPGDAQLLYDLGVAQDALDQAGPAQASYRTAIADDAGLLAPRVALGLLLARGGDFPAARAEFASAVVTATASSSGPATPTRPEDDALRARAYRALARLDAQTRPDDARDELLAALKLSPETPEDTVLTAELAARATNGSAAAETAYRRALAARPGDAGAAGGLAHLLTTAKNPEEARAVLESALQASPGDPALTAQLASLLAAGGKPGEAVTLLEPVAAAHPDDPDLARMLVRLYLAQGADAKADPLLARLATRFPEDGDLLDQRARVLIHTRRYADAEALLTTAVAHPSSFPTPAALGDAAGDLAFAASNNNDPAGALRALELRATVLPPSAATLFLAAIAHDRLHQLKQAKEAYRQFLAVAGGTLPDEEFEARHRLVALDHMH